MKFLHILGLSVLTLLLAVYIFVKREFQSPSDALSVVIGPSEVNLGNVEQGALVRRSFDITNRSGGIVDITSVNKSCGCTTAEVSQKVLKPGEHTELRTVINTAHKDGSFSGNVGVDWRLRDGSLFGHANALVVANIVTAARVMPPSFSLDAMDVDQAAYPFEFSVEHGGSS